MFSSAACAAFGVIAFQQRFPARTGATHDRVSRQGFRRLRGLNWRRGRRTADLMRGIAGEHHPAVHEPLHPAALELVQRDPLEIELVMAEHTRDPRPYMVRALLDRRVGKGTQLQVDAPDIVRLLVQQRRAAGVKRRIEPKPALGREFRRHLDVGDQELIFKQLPGEFRAHHLPQRRGGRHRRRRRSRHAADTVRQAFRSSAAHGRCAVQVPVTLLRQRRSMPES